MTPTATDAQLTSEAWSGIAGLEAAAPVWRELAAAAGLDALCNSPDWTRAYLEAWSRPDEPFGWTLRTAEGEPAGFVALRPEPPAGRLQPRRAMLVADGSFDSDYLDLAIRPGLELPVLEAVLDLVAERGGVDALLLSCVPNDSPRLAAVRELVAARGLWHREVDAPCAVAELPDSFDAFLKGLKSRMRSKVRSSLRKAEESGAKLAWCEEAAELDGHLEAMFELHGRRWRAAGEDGSFAEERRRAFYHRLTPELLARGELRFARLERGGRAVAYQYGAVAGGAYYQLQEGYDPELEAERIGVALRGLAIERLIGEGVRRYDYMAGMSRHKRDWGAVDRPCTTLALSVPGLRPRILFGARDLVERWRGRGGGRAAADEE